MIAFLIIISTYLFLFSLLLSNKIKLLGEYILLILWIDFAPNIITMFNAKFSLMQYLIIQIIWVFLLVTFYIKVKVVRKYDIPLLIFASYIVFNSFFIHFYGKDTFTYLLSNLVILFLLYKIFQSFTLDIFFNLFLGFIKKALLFTILLILLSYLLTGFQLTMQGERMTTFIGPAKLGSKMFFLSLAYLVIIFRYKKIKYNISYKFGKLSLLFFISVIILVFTQARISIFGFLISVIFIYLSNFDLKKILLVTSMFLIGVILLLQVPQLERRINLREQLNSIREISISFNSLLAFNYFASEMQGTIYDKIASGRFTLWNNILTNFGNTGLFGNGANFGKNYYKVSSNANVSFVESMTVNSNYHNDPILFYLSYGLIGLVLYLFIYLYLLFKFYGLTKSLNNKLSVLSNIMFLFLLGGVFISLFDNFYATHKDLFFAILGFFSTYRNNDDKN